jgi:hypothetical protein
MGFDHDVFISYANVDDKPLPGAAKGRVACGEEEEE